jgi:hypothetical protein
MHTFCIDIDKLNGKVQVPSGSADPDSDKHNPFAVLARLKSDRNES